MANGSTRRELSRRSSVRIRPRSSSLQQRPQQHRLVRSPSPLTWLLLLFTPWQAHALYRPAHESPHAFAHHPQRYGVVRWFTEPMRGGVRNCRQRWSHRGGNFHFLSRAGGIRCIGGILGTAVAVVEHARVTHRRRHRIYHECRGWESAADYWSVGARWHVVGPWHRREAMAEPG